MAEIIAILIPIIIEMITNKRKKTMIASVMDCMACWSDPVSRADFVDDVISAAIDNPDVSFGLDDAPKAHLAFAHFANDPLLPGFIAACYRASENQDLAA